MMPILTLRRLLIAAGAFAGLAFAASAADSGPGETTTTVYVGRQFESRDHDQPTKYVFNGDIRVASVIGSLSANKLLQRLRFWAGWNLVSLGVTAADLAGQLQWNQPGLVQGAYQWVESEGSYSELSPGQTVAGGAVLWVKAATNGVVGITGLYSEPGQIRVPAGGAYIAGTGLEAWTPMLPAGCAEWAFDATAQQWAGTLPDGLRFFSKVPAVIAPGEVVFLRDSLPVALAPPDPTLRIRYYHQDHLGSTSLATDAAGAVVEERAYYPFGASRNLYVPRQVAEPYDFAQKEREAESRLHYFESRFLNAPLARFLTPDSKYAKLEALSTEGFSAFLANPQAANLYAYVLNNPVTFTDPTGNEPNKDKKPGQDKAEQPESSGATLTISFGTDAAKNPPSLEIPIESFSKLPGKTPAASVTKEKPQPGEMQITRRVDEFSTALLTAAAEGKPFQATITLRGKDDQKPFLQMTLKGALMTGTSVSSHDNLAPVESLNIAFTDVKFVFPASTETAPQQPAEPQPDQSRGP